MSSIKSSIGDEFTILSISIPPQLAFPKSVTHHLYLKPYSPKIPTPLDSRSLFIANIPVDSTSAHFRAIVASLIGAGRFESITFSDEEKKDVTSAVVTQEQPRQAITRGKKRKRSSTATEETRDTSLPKTWDRELHRSGSTAVILLVDEKSVEAFLKATRKLHKPSSSKEGTKTKHPIWGEGIAGKVPALGSARYLTHHTLRFPDPTKLQASVDAFMTTFNKKEEEVSRQAKKARNVPDEEGFITVSRGGRTGPARKEETEMKRKEMVEKEERKRLEMGDFYRFQVRERRKMEQGAFVRAFEVDRRRVEGMRERRGRFKPER